MKRVLFVMALATVLVFAFSSVAMAMYAGWGTEEGDFPGYMSWTTANVIADLYADGNETGPHGDYTASTTKCAVCHSVHRAYSARDTAGVGDHLYLTAAGESCVACHTPAGANPTELLVEWPSVYEDGGPHAGQNCTGACHAGIHGGIASDYAVAASFLLNPALDEGMSAAIAAGNLGGGVTEGNLDTYWGDLTTAGKQGTRAMVTGYLCGQSGCHTSSQFAVNTWGYAEPRASDPEDPDTLDMLFTGHRTSMTRTSTCGGSTCHSSIFTPGDSWCSLCHDMIGKATNTTAWPHANRNITVWEWVRPAGMLETTEKVASAGNLWMYAGDGTYRDASGEPTSTLMWDGYVPDTTVVNNYRNDRINTRTVIDNAVGFGDVLGNINDGTCLKCHGYVSYFHGWQGSEPPTRTGDPTRFFSNK